MRKLHVALTVLTVLFVVSGCGAGTGVGGFLGYPGFIVDPIYYANIEVNDDPVDLGIRDVYAVVYTDASDTPIDSNLWVYFVPDDIDLAKIISGNFKPYVALRVNDTTAVTPGHAYIVSETLISSNFMVWMDTNDGHEPYTGDTIDINFDSISITKSATIKGEFMSTLHRGSSIALVEKFKFSAPVNRVAANPPEL